MSGDKKEKDFRRRFGSGDGSGSEGEGGLLKLFVNPDSDRGGGDGDGDERVKGVDEKLTRYETKGDVMTDGGFAVNVINVEVITGDAIASDVTAWKSKRAAATTLVHEHFLGKAEDEAGGRGWLGREDDCGEKYSVEEDWEEWRSVEKAKEGEEEDEDEKKDECRLARFPRVGFCGSCGNVRWRCCKNAKKKRKKKQKEEYD